MLSRGTANFTWVINIIWTGRIICLHTGSEFFSLSNANNHKKVLAALEAWSNMHKAVMGVQAKINEHKMYVLAKHIKNCHVLLECFCEGTYV